MRWCANASSSRYNCLSTTDQLLVLFFRGLHHFVSHATRRRTLQGYMQTSVSEGTVPLTPPKPRTYSFTHKHSRTHTHTHTHIHTHTQHSHTHTHTHTQHSHTHTHTHTHTRIALVLSYPHSHTHTHTHMYDSVKPKSLKAS